MTVAPLHSTSHARLGVACGLIVGLTFVAYSNAMHSPFVFDGEAWIKENPVLDRIWPPDGWLFSNRPVVMASFAINGAIHGKDVLGYHLINIAVHIISGLTLFGVARRVFAESPGLERYRSAAWGLALTTSLIWTLHPLQTESVTYVYQRFESLMGMFFLLAFYCFLRSQSSLRPWLWLTASIVAVLLSCGSKEVGAAAPVVIVWYDRAFLVPSWRELVRRRGWYYAVLAGVMLLPAVWALSHWDTVIASGIGAYYATPLWQYLATQVAVVAHYLRLSVWPVGLCLDLRWPLMDSGSEFIVATAAIVAVIGVTVWGCLRVPRATFLAGWFLLILAPTSSVLPLVDTAAEHRMYLPLAAVVAAGVVLGYELIERLAAGGAARWRSTAQWGIAAMVCIALGSTTFARNEVYESKKTVWADVVKKSPHNFRAWSNLGAVLGEEGRHAESAEYQRRALKCAPPDLGRSHRAKIHCRLGYALQRQGRYAEAMPHYFAALDLDAESGDPQAYLGGLATEVASEPFSDDPRRSLELGSVSLSVGDTKGAMQRFERAIELAPEMPEGFSGRGLVRARSGETAAAQQDFEIALKLDPDFADAHFHLGNLLRTTDPATAVAHYRAAIASRPGHADAHNNLGAMLAQTDPDAAAEHYRRALHLRPHSADAHNNYANLLARRGQFEEAAAHYRRALRLQPQMESARQNLHVVLGMLEDGGTSGS